MHVPEPNYSPHAPIDDEDGGDELIDRLAARAVELLGFATRDQVVAAMREYSPEWVEVALNTAARAKVPPRGWAWILGVLANWRKEGATVGLPKAKGKKVTVQENYNPGIGAKDVAPSEPGAGDAIRDIIRRTAAATAAPSPSRAPAAAFKARDEPGFLRLEAELEARERARRAAAMAPAPVEPAASSPAGAEAPSRPMPARPRRRRPAPLLRKHHA